MYKCTNKECNFKIKDYAVQDLHPAFLKANKCRVCESPLEYVNEILLKAQAYKNNKK